MWQIANGSAFLGEWGWGCGEMQGGVGRENMIDKAKHIQFLLGQCYIILK